MTAPFIVPQPVAGTATGWQVADWLDVTYKTPPAAGGTATVYLPQLEPRVMWTLTHMVCACTPGAGTQLRLYLDTVGPSTLRDGTASGDFDVADWPVGLIVPTSRGLVAQWTGAPDGAVGTLTIQGQIMRQAG